MYVFHYKQLLSLLAKIVDIFKDMFYNQYLGIIIIDWKKSPLK